MCSISKLQRSCSITNILTIVYVMLIMSRDVISCADDGLHLLMRPRLLHNRQGCRLPPLHTLLLSRPISPFHLP